MSKAIKMKAGEVTFLIETDESVEVPADLKPMSSKILEGVPSGMEPVVDITKVERHLADVRDLIITCSKGLLEAMASIPTPEKVTVEFGIKLAGEAGVPMLTKASGEANFKVSIEWKKDVVVTGFAAR
jgi:hypothetical protein